MCDNVKVCVLHPEQGECLQPRADILQVQWIIFRAELSQNRDPVCAVTFSDARQTFFPLSSSRL